MESTTMGTVSNWVKRVVAFVKADDESKILLLNQEMVKMYDNQIKEAKRRIAKYESELADFLEDKTKELEELEDTKAQAFISIDLDRIKTLQDRKSYYQQLDNNFNEALKSVKAKNEEIDEKKKATATSIESLNKVIAVLEEKLSMLKD